MALCCREELLSFSEHDSVKSPPKDLEESGIYRWKLLRTPIFAPSRILLLSLYQNRAAGLMSHFCCLCA